MKLLRGTEGRPSYLWWKEEFQTPATEQQLKNLAALYDLELVHRASGRDTPSHCWVMLRTVPGFSREHVLDFFDDSPIERYIEHLKQWRRRQI